MKNPISTILAAGTFLGLCLATTHSHAQGSYNNTPNYGYNSGYTGGGYGNGHATLGQNVYSLRQYGSQMCNAYGLESRNYGGCRHSSALLGEMRRYNGYTNTLATAYRGSCQKTYRRAACNVRDSLVRIQNLRRHARVSPQVCGLITRSYPLANYCHTNYASFRSAPVQVYPSRPSCVTRPPVVTHGHHGGYQRRGGLDVGSAIFGAVAGRVVHGIIHNH